LMGQTGMTFARTTGTTALLAGEADWATIGE
jgi:hypothetical protein